MVEWNFGSLSERQLCVRFWAPLWMERWTGQRWVLSPLRLLNPLNWWRVVKNRDNWRLWWKFCREVNHRCYCPEGCLFDGQLFVAGFGLGWFYSRYGGPVPCACDQVIAELEREELEA